MNIYGELLQKLKNGEPYALCTRLNPDGENTKWIEAIGQQTQADIKQYFYPEERLILFGGGHVSLAVSKIAALCGFSVVVCDDRPEFANSTRFSDARQTICGSFAECYDMLHITSYDYVVVVTRGHQYDLECLRQILSGNMPQYIGMMGSRKRTESVGRILGEEGYCKENIQKIHMPIGLKIGALTPEEIAVSIMAEIIGIRRHLSVNSKYASDTDYHLLEILAKENKPCAIATILSVNGSAPRDAGANMIIYSTGEIAGTIGGGYAEGEIIRQGVEWIGTNRHKVITINMLADPKKKNEMVCGGIMNVLIEGYRP